MEAGGLQGVGCVVLKLKKNMVVLFHLLGDGVELIIKNNKEHVCFNLVMDRGKFHRDMSI